MGACIIGGAVALAIASWALTLTVALLAADAKTEDA